MLVLNAVLLKMVNATHTTPAFWTICLWSSKWLCNSFWRSRSTRNACAASRSSSCCGILSKRDCVRSNRFLTENETNLISVYKTYDDLTILFFRINDANVRAKLTESFTFFGRFGMRFVGFLKLIHQQQVVRPQSGYFRIGYRFGRQIQRNQKSWKIYAVLFNDFCKIIEMCLLCQIGQILDFVRIFEYEL